MKKKLVSLLLALSLVVGSVAGIAPATTVEAATTEREFTADFEGGMIIGPDITLVKDGYTAYEYDASTNGMVPKTVDLKVINIDANVGAVNFYFSDPVLCYNYSKDGVNYIAGCYDDYTAGSDKATVSLDADHDGYYDVIQVQNLYNADYTGGDVLYAITFKSAERINNEIMVAATKAKRTFKASKLKKKAATVELGVTTRAQSVSYKVVKGAKYVTVDESGKVTVKKKAPKGTYKIQMSTTESEIYNACTAYTTITVK